MPDNICVAPWGEVFMAEDGDGDNYVRVLAPTGEIYDFARNAHSDSEFAGVCFSPDGKTMFVNIQGDGITLAVRGPFPAVEEPGTTTGGDDTTGGDVTTSDGSTGEAPTTSAGTASGTDGDTGDPTSGGAPTSDGPSTGDGGTTGGSGSDSDSGGADGDPAGCGCDANNGNPVADLALAVAGVAVLRSVTRPAPLATRSEPADE